MYYEKRELQNACISLQYAEAGQGRDCNLTVIPFSIGKREFYLYVHKTRESDFNSNKI